MVKSYNGSTRTQWWNTNKTNETAAFIDFTNPAAAEWYVNRLKKLQIESGIDSFKFDGGEVYLLPEVTHYLYVNNLNIESNNRIYTFKLNVPGLKIECRCRQTTFSNCESLRSSGKSVWSDGRGSNQFSYTRFADIRTHSRSDINMASHRRWPILTHPIDTEHEHQWLWIHFTWYDRWPKQNTTT